MFIQLAYSKFRRFTIPSSRSTVLRSIGVCGALFVFLHSSAHAQNTYPVHLHWYPNNSASFVLNQAQAGATNPSNFVPGQFNQWSGFETGLRLSGFEGAWSRGLSGKGQLIAVADTGVDSGDLRALHPDLSGQIFAAQNFVDRDAVTDLVGHGTHVIGSIVATGRGSQGRVRGGAPGAKIYLQKIWSRETNSLIVPLQFTGLFKSAWDQGARIQVASWGDQTQRALYTGLSSDIDSFAYQFKDFLLVLSAGNTGFDSNGDGAIDLSTLYSPGTSKNALVVGSSENLTPLGVQKTYGEANPQNFSANPYARDLPSNNANGLAAFSARGPTADGRLKPDIVAPGTNILSTCSRAQSASPLWGRYGSNPNLYCWGGGTSSSAPIVAAAAALVRESLLARGYRNPSSALIKALLMNTATDLFPGQFSSNSGEIRGRRPNVDEGFGRINANLATLHQQFFIVDEPVGVQQNESKKYPLTVKTAGVYELTLQYTDPAAAPLSQQVLVNDIDLGVLSQGRAVASGQNRRDNGEHIQVQLSPGDYELAVFGARVVGMGAKQPFAFVVRKL